MPPKPLRSFLSALIATAFLFQSALPSTSLANSSTPQQAAPLPDDEATRTLPKTADLAGGDPALQDFIASLEHMSPNAGIPVDVNDPSLDQDPGFLRSQAWLDGQKTDEMSEVRAQASGDGLVLSLPGTTKQLKLNLPLDAFYMTDETVFLSLRDSAKMFKVAAGGDTPGEGIFAMSRSELLASAESQRPVALYFIPLPDVGWTGSIEAIEVPEADALAIRNAGGGSLQLELQDVARLIESERANLKLAAAFTARNYGFGNGLGVLYPAPGTTQAFGLFFTGLDLGHPANSLRGAIASAESPAGPKAKARDRFGARSPPSSRRAPRPLSSRQTSPSGRPSSRKFSARRSSRPSFSNIRIPTCKAKSWAAGPTTPKPAFPSRRRSSANSSARSGKALTCTRKR
jgi:hypothetical protein